MGVKYILAQAGSKMGLNPSDEQQRAVLVRFLNEGARELYAQSDMAGSLMEMPFKVNGDQTISFPSDVGRIRAMRDLNNQSNWNLRQMRPRYYAFNWTDMWKGFRLKNKQCLQNSVTNQSQAVITVSATENPPVVVTITGRTEFSNRVVESVTLDQNSVTTTNTFIDYTAITKDRANGYDITISDVDGNVLTVVPNNNLSAQYQIVDVSQCPFLPQNTSPLDNYLEVLYKVTLNYLTDDGDEFPGFDYDDIIVNKMMQLFKEEQDKTDAATMYDNKATRSLARLNEEQNRGTEDTVSVVQNKHDSILPRVGTGLRRRVALYVRRRY